MKPHIPVLLNEAVEGLNVSPGKRFIDATYGGGGHGKEILRLGGALLGIDTDPEAVESAKEEFRIKHLELNIEGRWKIVQGNFRDIGHIAKENGFANVDGVLFDLGVSSHQLDTPERGFSYRFTDAHLDLRLNQSKGETAAQLVNRLAEEELYEIFARFAEEELARPIAYRIARARAIAPIETTGDLVRIVGDSPARLSRVFQALRIAVNDELGALREGLDGSKKLLRENGRLVVISFHSLEDRIVKQFMQQEGWTMITRRPIVPTKKEIQNNPRTRSAKLRIAEKL